MGTITAYITLHAVLISSILAAIVAIDHALAGTDLVKASSTAQAVVNGIGSVVSFLVKLLPTGGSGTPPTNPPAAS